MPPILEPVTFSLPFSPTHPRSRLPINPAQVWAGRITSVTRADSASHPTTAAWTLTPGSHR